MKATGIVRRIDDLGRVVIPKEIRRVLRLREGDPLEIFTEKDGEVIFKKYSPMGELAEFAAQICESLHKTAGATAVTVEIKEGGLSFIRVADNGCGISEEDLKKVKQKFFRANHIKRGSGIGLAVADEIISLHGGSVDIKSTIGKGTQVIISIPY
jgi:AbrB family transcriptional regulator (stage V sporulation protein T)